MTAPDSSLVEEIRTALRSVADPSRAPAMQAYMKSAMPFLGAAKPARTAALRPALAHAPADRAVWEATVRRLYDDAAYREERYAALALMSVRIARPWHDPDLVPLLEHLVVTGAWWDLVDETAGRHVAPTHRAHPEPMAAVLRRWSLHDDLWLRRAAIIGQLGSGAATDRDLLVDVIAPSLDRPEFWLRKAIGWALRDLAHRDPSWVRAYVDATPGLSPLSRREATKNL
ncbi:MAG TPA: DNA alkylation repair protein [Candidatus Nanopelagicales bacterium]|nr:DNA alkylation repair protein [Candidatus Nanopelagicales bacterium]